MQTFCEICQSSVFIYLFPMFFRYTQLNRSYRSWLVDIGNRQSIRQSFVHLSSPQTQQSLRIMTEKQNLQN